MIDTHEMLAAMRRYAQQINGHPRLRQILKDWSPVIHFVTREGALPFTMRIVKGQVAETAAGHAGAPDLVIRGAAADLLALFNGALNPTQKYLDGEITVKGSQMDVIKLDAISMILWPEED